MPLMFEPGHRPRHGAYVAQTFEVRGVREYIGSAGTVSGDVRSERGNHARVFTPLLAFATPFDRPRWNRGEEGLHVPDAEHGHYLWRGLAAGGNLQAVEATPAHEQHPCRAVRHAGHVNVRVSPP